MNILGKLFSRMQKKQSRQQLSDIADTIDPLVNQICLDILIAHKDLFLQKPIDYIVPAVWGVMKNAELDEVQKNIFDRIKTVEDKIMQTFGFTGLSKSQEFAVRYLVKGLFIARITYMIELVKNLSADPEKLAKNTPPALLH